MFEFLQFVMVSALFADLVVSRGAQFVAWVTKAEQTVSTDVAGSVKSVETAVSGAASTVVSDVKSVASTVATDVKKAV
jgi:hypothetical protein